MEISDLDSFGKVLEKDTFVLAFFTGRNCSVCHVLQPKIESLLASHFPNVKFIEVQTEKAPELSARYSVYTVPVLLFFVNGKEYIKEVRIIDVSLLNKKLGKLIDLYSSEN